LRGRLHIDSPAAPVITDAISLVVRNRVVIYIVNVRDIHIRDGAVISQCAIVPISAVVTPAGVAEAVVDSAIKADVRTPIARMPDINVVLVSPVRRRPESIHPGSHYPHSGYPIIAGLCIAPVTRRPQVVLARTFRLAVLGQRRRRLGSLNTLGIRALIGITLALLVTTRIGGRRVALRLLGGRWRISLRLLSGRLRIGLLWRALRAWRGGSLISRWRARPIRRRQISVGRVGS